MAAGRAHGSGSGSRPAGLRTGEAGLLLRDLAASAPGPALLVGGDGAIRWGNPAAALLLGLEDAPPAARGAAGVPLLSLVRQGARADALRAALADPTTRARSGQGATRVEVLLPNGASAWMEATVLAFSADTATHRLVLLRELTARERELEELRERATLLERQNEASIDGILILDAEGRVVSVNPRFLEMWGVPEHLLRVGGPDDEALASVLDRLQDPETFLEKIAWIADHPRAETRDEVHLKDGRVLERWSSPVHSPGGDLLGRGWYFRDITLRTQAESRLQEAYRRLREADRGRNKLLHVISHDIGSSLTPVRTELFLLRQALGAGGHASLDDDARAAQDADPRVLRAIDVVERSVLQVERLVEDLRDVARIEGGKLGLQPRSLDLAALAREAASAFQGEARGRGITLTLDIPDALVAHADAQRVSQVLFNLLTNALKFTPRGGEVRVQLSAHGREAHVEVTDTGRGLAPGDAGRLFQPFTQVHEDSEVAERGTGLGLYICRSLVEAHGGRIWAESPGHGRGSTFAFTLPLDPADRAG